MGFSQILGQGSATSILRNGLINGRLAHAYLLVGQEGVGKRATALMLTKAMNCQSPPAPGDACELCPSCIKINSWNHADLLLVEPDGEVIKIDQIRELQKRLRFRPMEGKSRACLLDPADRMNPAAANALLKTLEEPPEETHLFLITSRPHHLLPTIRSRCQWVNFKPLTSAHIIQILRRNQEMDGEKASFYASLAGGSAGKALALSDKVDFQKRLEWLQAFASLSRKSTEEIFDSSEQIAKGEEEIDELLDLWKVWIRDLTVWQIQGGQSAERIINRDLTAQIEKEAAQYSCERLDLLFALVTKTQRAIALKANRQLAMENLMLAIRQNNTAMSVETRKPRVAGMTR